MTTRVSNSNIKKSKLVTKKRSQKPLVRKVRTKKIRSKKNRTKTKRGGEGVQNCKTFRSCKNNKDNKTTCMKNAEKKFSCQKESFLTSSQNVVKHYFEFGSSKNGNVYALIKKPQENTNQENTNQEYDIFKKVGTDTYEKVEIPISDIVENPIQYWEAIKKEENESKVKFQRKTSVNTVIHEGTLNKIGNTWKYSDKK